MNNIIVEELISGPDSPLTRISTNMIYRLSPDQLRAMAREDDGTVRERERLDEQIGKLRRARKAADAARLETSSLGEC